MIEPLWYLNTDEKVPIAQEMDTFVTNLLTFCEDILVLSLEKCKTAFPIMIVEIPEKERDANCPKRFRMTIDESKLKRPQNSQT